MNKFDYLSVSGQHLLIFVTLHEVGTVTATAEKLGITQSAVSHSLQKLRDIFCDELFVRAGRSVTPTVHSRSLYPEIKAMLEKLNNLTQSNTFTPSAANIHYKICANDYQSNLWFPSLYEKLAPQVSSLSLEISPSKKPSIELLRSNDVDMVISPIAPDHSDIVGTRLFSDVSHCFYDPTVRSAPTSIAELKLSKFVSLTFLKGMSMNRKYDDVIRMLDDNTVIRVSNFASIPAFIRGTDLLAIMPSRLQYTLGYDRLANTPTPYQASQLTMYMLWHKRYQNDAQHRWFREQMAWLGNTKRQQVDSRFFRLV